MVDFPIFPAEDVLTPPNLQQPLSSSDDGAGTPDSLYLRFAPMLRRVALRKYDVPVSDVDGLVHDVFATYLTNPTAVRDPRAYLIGGICNAAREYWRERRREVSLSANEQEEPLADEVFDGLAERLTVAATVARLRSRCREVLRRYYFDGDPTETIAAAIDTTPRNVNYLLHVCRGRARKIYETLTKVR